jgi:hypothetical protein
MGKETGDHKGAPATAVDEEAGFSTSSNSSQEHIVKPTSTWKGYIWDTWELPKEERWLLFKVDAFVLTFASVSSLRLSQVCSPCFMLLWLTQLHRLATSSKISTSTMSTMLSSVECKKISPCMEISL